MLRFVKALSCACISTMFWMKHVHAQPHALTVNDCEPADTTSMWFVLQSEALERPRAAFAGLTLQYLHRPVVVYDSQWKEAADLVARQTATNLALGVHFAERVLFNINVPILMATLGESISIGGDEYWAPSGSGVGDMRFELNVTALRLPTNAIEVLVGARMWLPTGNRYQLTSDGGARIAPQVSLAGHGDLFKYAARVAYHHSFVSSDFAAADWDSRIQAAAAFGIQLWDGRFVVGPELFGSTTLGDDIFGQVVTRAEALLGAHYRVDAWNVGLGWGVGLTSGVGVPDLRALIAVGGNLFEATAANDADRSGDTPDEEQNVTFGYTGEGQ